MKNSSAPLSRTLQAATLAAVCLLAIPLSSQAKDHNNSWQSVTGFLEGLGNNIVRRGKRALEPEYRYEDERQFRVPYNERENNSLEASVQRALARNGYYNGPIDGNLGPMSRRAISRYQSDRGLEVTGYPNSSLLRSLGM